MSEGPFTWEWVAGHLILKERKAEGPDRAGCDRIAAKLNQAFACEMRKNEQPARRNPLGFTIAVPGRTAAVRGGWSHADKAFQEQRRWHAYAPALAEVMKAELDRVNPHAIDIGYSADGPIVRALVDAIPIITGEHPRPEAIAKRLKRS
jgi:hypothetical protein